MFNTTNPADMEIYGGEFEITALPTPDLTINTAIGVSHAEYTNISSAVVSQEQTCRSSLATGNSAGIALACNAGFVDSTGHVADPVRVPDYTFAITATYNIDLGFLTIRPTATLNVEGAHAIGTAGDSRPGSDPRPMSATSCWWIWAQPSSRAPTRMSRSRRNARTA